MDAAGRKKDILHPLYVGIEIILDVHQLKIDWTCQITFIAKLSEFLFNEHFFIITNMILISNGYRQEWILKLFPKCIDVPFSDYFFSSIKVYLTI